MRALAPLFLLVAACLHRHSSAESMPADKLPGLDSKAPKESGLPTCESGAAPERTAQVLVTTQDMEGRRLAGKGQVPLPDSLVDQLVSRGVARAAAKVRVCIDAQGMPVCASFKNNSGDENIDQVTIDAISGWRFRPFEENGEPMAVCYSVSFVWQLTADGG